MWNRLLILCAGLLGASGVAVGAAGAHLGGGDFARLSSDFLLFHAAAVPGILALPMASGRRIRSGAASLLVAGSAAFSGDLAILAFTTAHGVTGLAPAGGLFLMAGWLGVAVSAFRE